MSDLALLRARIAFTRLSERARLDRDWQRLRAHLKNGQDITAAVAKLSGRIDQAVAWVERLRTAPLKLEYDPDLPITAHREEIFKTLDQHQVVILCGATGSGKSTQLPKLCIEAGRGIFGLIGHTQPRRIAARALANRVAQELATSVGGAVGYQVRFTDHTGPQCRVKLMTDGILLRELEADRDLRRYDTLIIDEAHERSLNIDLLLGVLKQLIARRDDLKLIITSATIDPQKFSSFFNGAPIIEVSGRSYPVEVRYRPLYADDEEGTELSLPQGIVAAVQELERESRGMGGDVLVFLPGEKQIREAAKALQDAQLKGTEVLPLFARLSVADQERIFARHSSRRVVLATNVAETSLTVPGVRFVVDSGLARISRYSVRGKIQRLPIEPIAKASADQRKGRCGREAEGICIRLYSEADFAARDEFTAAEIQRTNLASVILKLATLGLPEPSEFPFIDPPELKLVNDGYRLLQELKAVDQHRTVTSLGKQLAALPLDPRLARMLLAADHHRCLREMLIVAAFLSAQDPRERPVDVQQQADQHHASYADARSDFMTVLTIWQRFHAQAAALSGNQLRKWCREQFLSFIRMREWQEVQNQLRDAIDELGLRLNQVAANYAELHQAILTGFLGGIGALEENREYLGARSMRFIIAPGTPLASRPPKWIVAANLIETTRTYARMVASVEPQWIEAAGSHLLKRSYAEPHWMAERGFVAAYESTALYGLMLSTQRRINYGSVFPKEAREIFVRCALVAGQSPLKAEFIEHNRALQRQVEDIEARLRRRDVLVDEQAQVEFYLARLPAAIHSTAAFEQWWREQQHALLHMTLDDLMRREVSQFNAADYPDAFECAGNYLPLTYKFEPTELDDGVTLTVPALLLSAVNEQQLAWCVPGWRFEKVIEILRALPKAMRKSFVPVPQFAARAVAELHAREQFSSAVAAWITQHSGTGFNTDDLLALIIPAYLKAFIRVVDLSGRELASGRDLKQLLRETRRQISAGTPEKAQDEQCIKTWDFDELPAQRQVRRDGINFTVFPTLQDRGDCVALVELPHAQQAERSLRMGVSRLLALNLSQQFKFARQQFSGNRELMLLGQGVSAHKPLPEALAERAMQECFLPEGTLLPRTRSAFEQLIAQHRSELNQTIERLVSTTLSMLKELRVVRQAMQSIKAPAAQAAITDINAQLTILLPEDFLSSIPAPWFGHLPRYLKAIARRLERLPANASRDMELAKQLQPFVTGYRDLKDAHADTLPVAERLKWMIEEFRVSLFAQDLRTAVPVSAKRLTEQLALANKEAG